MTINRIGMVGIGDEIGVGDYEQISSPPKWWTTIYSYKIKSGWLDTRNQSWAMLNTKRTDRRLLVRSVRYENHGSALVRAQCYCRDCQKHGYRAYDHCRSDECATGDREGNSFDLTRTEARVAAP